MFGGAGEGSEKEGNGDEPDSYVHVGDPKEKGLRPWTRTTSNPRRYQ
ncbi:MAG TPA: hypothetical protein VNG73_06185 [Gemmatimonadaceae bacterium]|nr:hypothetical protein [Gemmatimonadaceae bacterium]